jgi:class 3 adenylate cyclase/YHS domain-containing protein
MMSGEQHEQAAGDPDSRAEGELTVVFVDLVRFTALTDIHGDITAADAASALGEVTSTALGAGDRLVKSVGDGVLLVARSPAAGLRLAGAIIEGLHDLDVGLDARGGVHHGSVVRRNGDVFGATVNLAARLAELPPPGWLAVTRQVALSAGEVDLAVTPRGSVELRGVREPVEIFELDPCRHDGEWLTDPVCGMRLRAGDAIAVLRESGESIGFCSQRCAELFDADARAD